MKNARQAKVVVDRARPWDLPGVNRGQQWLGRDVHPAEGFS